MVTTVFTVTTVLTVVMESLRPKLCFMGLFLLALSFISSNDSIYSKSVCAFLNIGLDFPPESGNLFLFYSSTFGTMGFLFLGTLSVTTSISLMFCYFSTGFFAGFNFLLSISFYFSNEGISISPKLTLILFGDDIIGLAFLFTMASRFTDAW